MNKYQVRPPTLAQQRFDATRASFRELSLADRFQRIYRSNLWGADTSVSGLGSERRATASLCLGFQGVARELGIASLLDAPCGDAGWIEMALGELELRYLGVDIVPEIIAKLNERAVKNGPGLFQCADITGDVLPYADAILCRDCLVHLSFENIRRAVANFQRTGSSYLLTTTFTEWTLNADIEDGDWRPLNFVQAPFFWPAPIGLINENCVEAGGAYRDKCLAVWRLSELPSSLAPSPMTRTRP